MAVIRGYEHDLFVSYAHIDNQPLKAGEAGWVDMLLAKVQAEVCQRLGTRAFDCWMDHELEGNLPFSPEILRAVRGSALLLVVLSPAYLKSEWCRRERNEFLAAVKDRVERGSLFLVRARPVDQGEIPPEFGALLGYSFSVLDPDMRAERPLGIPDPLEPKFIKRVFELSQDIKQQVARLNAEPASPAPGTRTGAPAPTGTRCVFVAPSTDDLADREDDLRAYLSQAGISVLPATWYPQTDAAAFEAAMMADLRRCNAFAQLLGPSHGRKLPFAPEARLPRLQYELAQRAGIPIVQWRERGLDLAAVEDAAHRMLLDQARACGLEEFKRAVVDEARKDRTPAAAAPAGNVVVFVNADSPDRDLARQVGNALGQFGIECYWPLENGPADELRKDLEDNLRTCDGVLLVYGATGATWVRRQLREARKILSQRERPLAALAVFEGPPPEKVDLGVAIPRLVTLNCRSGIDVGALKQFVEALHP